VANLYLLAGVMKQKAMTMRKIVPITDQMMARARDKASKYHGSKNYVDLLNDSVKITMGTNKTWLMGYVGEEVFFKGYKDSEHTGAVGHDFTIFGREVDIKTTIVKTFEYSKYVFVPKKDVHKCSGIYCFVYIKPDFSEGMIAGYTTNKDFVIEKNFFKKGSDTSIGRYKHQAPLGMYRTHISNLYDLPTALSYSSPSGLNEVSHQGLSHNHL